MRLHLIMALAACLGIAAADTLQTKDGKTAEGTYLGGDARSIRMAVGDQVQSFDVANVENIRFGSSAPGATPGMASSTAAQSSPAVAPAAVATKAASSAPAAAAVPAQSPTAAIQAASPSPLAPAENTATAAANADPKSSGHVELPAGLEIVVRMIDDVDSETNKVGQTFRASVDEPVVINGETVVPQGADVLTRLASAEKSGKLTGKTELTLELDSLTLNGKRISLDSRDVTQASGSRGSRTAKVVGGTAALGAIIGAIAGGGTGAAIGAASGAGAGTAIQMVTKGQRVRIPSETRLTFVLANPAKI